MVYRVTLVVEVEGPYTDDVSEVFRRAESIALRALADAGAVAQRRQAGVR